jgi:hypothetical protein
MLFFVLRFTNWKREKVRKKLLGVDSFKIPSYASTRKYICFYIVWGQNFPPPTGIFTLPAAAIPTHHTNTHGLVSKQNRGIFASVLWVHI